METNTKRIVNRINLSKSPPMPIYEAVINSINQLQIIKRQRALMKEEKEVLFNMKMETQEMEIICCANILLNSFDEFDIIFNKLEDSKKEVFKSWPIWNLYPSELKFKIQEPN